MASGDMLGWNAMIHKSGAKRAKGGSGALTQAMAKCLLSHGGEIICEAEVAEISGGKPWRVSYRKVSVVAAAVPSGGRGDDRTTKPGGENESGSASVSPGSFTREPTSPPLGTAAATTEISATRVVSAIHLHTLFNMLPDAPPELKKRVARTRIGNGFGMIVRHASRNSPTTAMRPRPPVPLPGTKDYQTSLQLLCPSIDYLNSSHRDFMFGLPPQKPSVVAMSFSSLDPTLAPEGKHVLFTWGQYHPYELSNGENWTPSASAKPTSSTTSSASTRPTCAAK